MTGNRPVAFHGHVGCDAADPGLPCQSLADLPVGGSDSPRPDNRLLASAIQTPGDQGRVPPAHRHGHPADTPAGRDRQTRLLRAEGQPVGLADVPGGDGRHIGVEHAARGLQTPPHATSQQEDGGDDHQDGYRQEPPATTRPT
ncbi:hypothetical protein, partial [Parascardovia denticolens]|uniref:hypothetical protein n=1 Tax=Parascardovia denticolens TaxID=78258 RepID=UPI00167F7355